MLVNQRVTDVHPLFTGHQRVVKRPFLVSRAVTHPAWFPFIPGLGVSAWQIPSVVAGKIERAVPGTLC